MEAKLVVVGGEMKASEINLKLPAIIGRGREAAITLAHALVSRQHCELFEDAGRLMVKDLGSLNGTFVDNERITECELPTGHLLTVGTVTFRAVYGEDGAAIMPPKKARTDTEVPDGTVFTPKSSRGAAANQLDTEVEEIEEILEFDSVDEGQLADATPTEEAGDEMPMFLDVGQPVKGPANKGKNSPPAPAPAAADDAGGDDEVEEVLEFGDLADLGLEESAASAAHDTPAAAAPQPAPSPFGAAPQPEPMATAANESLGDIEPVEDVVDELGEVEVIDELDVVEMLEEPAEAAPPPAPAAPPPKPAAAKAAPPAAPAAKTAPTKPAGAPAKSTPAPQAAPKATAPAAGSAEKSDAAAAPDEDLDDFFKSLQ